MITQRAFIIGIVGICFYIIALVNQLPSYYSILTWLSMTVLVSCAGVAALSLQGVSCKWRILRTKATASLLSNEPAQAQDEDRVLEEREEATSNKFAAHMVEMQRRARAEESLEQDSMGGSGPMLEIEMSNAGTLNKTGVLVDVRLRHLSRAFALTRRFMIESLPSGTSLTSTLTLRGLPRGRYEIVEIAVTGSDVLGLFRARRRIYFNNDAQAALRAQRIERAGATAQTSWRFYVSLILLGMAAVAVGFVATRLTRFGGSAAQIGGTLSTIAGGAGLWARQRARLLLSSVRPHETSDQSQQLIVGPATIFAASLPESSTADIAGHEASSVDALGRGDELRGTRPYVAGDDLRTVHWKSTARLGQLVVREFHRPARSQSVVIWDGALDTSTRASDEARVEDVELCLSLAASICRGWVDRNLSCTLLRLDSRPRVIKNTSSGKGAPLSPFVEALADADSVRITSLLDALGAHVNVLPGNGEVFLITGRELVPETPLPLELARVAALFQRRGTSVTVVGVSRTNTSPNEKSTREKRRFRFSFSRFSNMPFEIKTSFDGSGARVISLVRHQANENMGSELSALMQALLQASRRSFQGSAGSDTAVGAVSEISKTTPRPLTPLQSVGTRS